MDLGSQRGPGQGTCVRVIFYVSVPVQLKVLIPYMVGDPTGCSEGCAVIQSGLAEMSEMVLGCTTRTVVSPLVHLVWTGGTEISLENREKQRGSEGLALLDLVN